MLMFVTDSCLYTIVYIHIGKNGCVAKTKVGWHMWCLYHDFLPQFFDWLESWKLTHQEQLLQEMLSFAVLAILCEFVSTIEQEVSWDQIHRTTKQKNRWQQWVIWYPCLVLLNHNKSSCLAVLEPLAVRPMGSLVRTAGCSSRHWNRGSGRSSTCWVRCSVDDEIWGLTSPELGEFVTEMVPFLCFPLSKPLHIGLSHFSPVKSIVLLATFLSCQNCTIAESHRFRHLRNVFRIDELLEVNYNKDLNKYGKTTTHASCWAPFRISGGIS